MSIDRFKNLLFWRYQYVKRKALKDYTADWRTIVQQVCAWEDEGLKGDTHRYVSNALLSQLQFGESSFDLSSVPSDILSTYRHYVGLSARYGYYLLDIVQEDNSLDLIKYVNENDSTPPPPIPFVQQDPWESFVMKMITVEMHDVEYHPVGDKQVNESLNQASQVIVDGFKASAAVEDSYSEELNRKDKVERLSLRELVVEKYIEGNKGNMDIPTADRNELIKSYNKVFPSSFRVDSNLQRAAALYLWDCAQNSEKSWDGAVRKIREIWKPDLEGNPVEKQFGEWVSKTERCIEMGQVLSIVSRP